MIPFFVVDRQMSLEILKYCEIDKLPFKIGLMGHANTSKNFQQEFRNFKAPNIVKMCDSGVFTKDGCIPENYTDLFTIYENMHASYGIIIDTIKNSTATIESAKEAISVYNQSTYNFKLVGVAQGSNLDDYLSCYQRLKDIGYTYIAIGGLLKKNINSARYVKVENEGFLKEVVESIRRKYPNDWLFLLGCYHPKRHKFFQLNKIYGGDYKGWVFNYQVPQTFLNKLFQKLNEMDSKSASKLNSLKHDRLITIAEIDKNKHLDISKDDNSTLLNQLNKIEKEIIKLRKISGKKRELNNYLSLIKIYETIFNLDIKEKRKLRFKQIRSYLNSSIFSFYKKYLLILPEFDEINCNLSFAFMSDISKNQIFKKLLSYKQQEKLLFLLDVVFLSCKYGLLNLYDIPFYKQEIIQSNSKIVNNQSLLNQINDRISNIDYENIFFFDDKDSKCITRKDLLSSENGTKIQERLISKKDTKLRKITQILYRNKDLEII